jgi:uncharacterized protein
MELRNFTTELRATDSMRIGGLAVPWGSLSEDLGGFREVINRGAFDGTINDENADVVLLWAHDDTKPMARRSARSLSLRDEVAGLAFESTLNGTSWSRDAHEAIRSGAVKTVSFGFTVPDNGATWRTEPNGRLTRIVNKANLIEISPVARAAYSTTAVGVRVGIRSAADVLAAAVVNDATLRDLVKLSLDLELERSK